MDTETTLKVKFENGDTHVRFEFIEKIGPSWILSGFLMLRDTNAETLIRCLMSHPTVKVESEPLLRPDDAHP